MSDKLLLGVKPPVPQIAGKGTRRRQCIDFRARERPLCRVREGVGHRRAWKGTGEESKFGAQQHGATCVTTQPHLPHW